MLKPPVDLDYICFHFLKAGAKVFLSYYAGAADFYKIFLLCHQRPTFSSY